MRRRYEAGEAGVIRAYAEAIRRNGMSPQQKQMHQYFSFRLAAARSLYAARFLADHDPERAQLKGGSPPCSGRRTCTTSRRTTSPWQTRWGGSLNWTTASGSCVS